MGALEAKDEEAVKGLKETEGRDRAAIRYLQDTGRGADVTGMLSATQRAAGGTRGPQELPGKLNAWAR